MDCRAAADDGSILRPAQTSIAGRPGGSKHRAADVLHVAAIPLLLTDQGSDADGAVALRTDPATGT